MDRRIKVQPINYLLRVQVVALVLIVFIIFCFWGYSAAIACFYGSLIAIVNTLIQRWRLINAAMNAGSSAIINLRKAYRCVVERWVITIGMFAIGFGVMSFSPLPVMVGFVFTQVALLFGTRIRHN